MRFKMILCLVLSICVFNVYADSGINTLGSPDTGSATATAAVPPAPTATMPSAAANTAPTVTTAPATAATTATPPSAAVNTTPSTAAVSEQPAATAATASSAIAAGATTTNVESSEAAAPMENMANIESQQPNYSIYIDANVGLNTSWSAPAYNINVGYLFNPYFGIEAGVTFSNNYNYSWNGGSFNTDFLMYDVALKGILPLGDIFGLYAKLGVGQSNYAGWSSNYCINCSGPSYYGSNYGMLYGAGAQFNLSPSWSLHLEDYTVTGNNPNVLMFGGEFKF